MQRNSSKKSEGHAAGRDLLAGDGDHCQDDRHEDILSGRGPSGSHMIETFSLQCLIL